MAVRTHLLRGVLALSVGAMALFSGVGPAHADSEARSTQQFTFTSASSGNSVTCSVEAYAVVFGAGTDARREAFASLKGYGGDPSCQGGSGSLTATYRSSSGVLIRSGAGGDGAVYWTSDDVGPGSPNLVVDFRFTFADCLSNCDVNLAVAPK